MNFTMKDRWEAVAEPAWECNQAAFQDFFRRHGHRRNVLNCAIPLARAKALTDFTMPQGWNLDKSLIASVGFGAPLPPQAHAGRRYGSARSTITRKTRGNESGQPRHLALPSPWSCLQA